MTKIISVLPATLASISSRSLVTAPVLVMTDKLFLAGLLLGLVVARIAFYVPLDANTVIKHTPMLMCLIAFILAEAGNQLYRSRNKRTHINVIIAAWPLFYLALFMVLGGIYALMLKNIPNTFMSFGIYMLFVFIAARMCLLTESAVRLTEMYFLFLLILGLLSLVAAAISFSSGEAPFHELEVLIISLAVYFAKARESRKSWHIFAAYGLIASTLLFRKNTGYLTGAGTLLYLWWSSFNQITRYEAIRLWLIWIIRVFLISLIIGVYLHVLSRHAQVLPSGNLEFRMYTYMRALYHFLDSPFWGTGFAESSVERFDLYEIDLGDADNMLPSHSNILDILAHGGLIGILLWLGGYVMAGRLIVRQLLATTSRAPEHIQRIAHSLFCMTLLSILVYAFNPILMNPPRAITTWANMGFLLGLALRYSQIPENNEPNN